MLLWYPTIRLLGCWDLEAVVVSLLQFPFFAAVFAICLRWWSAVIALMATVTLYAAFVAAAAAAVTR